MTADTTIGKKATAKTGMTLDELGEFIQRAHHLGASGAEVIEVTTTGWSKQRIKTAKVGITATDTADQ